MSSQARRAAQGGHRRPSQKTNIPRYVFVVGARALVIDDILTLTLIFFKSSTRIHAWGRSKVDDTEQ